MQLNAFDRAAISRPAGRLSGLLCHARRNGTFATPPTLVSSVRLSTSHIRRIGPLNTESAGEANASFDIPFSLYSMPFERACERKTISGSGCPLSIAPLPRRTRAPGQQLPRRGPQLRVSRPSAFGQIAAAVAARTPTRPWNMRPQPVSLCAPRKRFSGATLPETPTLPAPSPDKAAYHRPDAPLIPRRHVATLFSKFPRALSQCGLFAKKPPDWAAIRNARPVPHKCPLPCTAALELINPTFSPPQPRCTGRHRSLRSLIVALRCESNCPVSELSTAKYRNSACSRSQGIEKNASRFSTLQDSTSSLQKR
ncbi:hypothetical protein CDD83_7599 [Cordyceps sp. RAO-2017]|nr:hypothetical protein CDD83_7599 [Cordyceps sp. RAO-2017]